MGQIHHFGEFRPSVSRSKALNRAKGTYRTLRKASKHWRKVDRRKWRKARLEALWRDDWKCRLCERRGRLEVDHIKPLADGGALYDLDNLRTLCRDCHIGVTRAANIKRLSPGRQAWRKLIDDMMQT